MANSRSAQKRVRSSERKRMINRQRLSRIRTFVRKLKDVVASGDAQRATKMFLQVQSEIDRGASKGVISRERASRQVATMNQLVKGLTVSGS